MLNFVIDMKESIHSKYQDNKHILPERADLKKAVHSLEMISQ